MEGGWDPGDHPEAEGGDRGDTGDLEGSGLSDKEEMDDGARGRDFDDGRGFRSRKQHTDDPRNAQTNGGGTSRESGEELGPFGKNKKADPSGGEKFLGVPGSTTAANRDGGRIGDSMAPHILKNASQGETHHLIDPEGEADPDRFPKEKDFGKHGMEKVCRRPEPQTTPGSEMPSSSQVTVMMREANSPMKLLLKGAARLSDLRNWIGGKGVLVRDQQTNTIILRLSSRKTDQGAMAPMDHIVGPIQMTKEEQETLEMDPNVWKVFPLGKQSEKIKFFLKELQSMKKKAGVKSFIQFRRTRARIAAQRTTTAKVAELLGHRQGSTSTKRYTQALDVEEMKARLKMTR